ncbi:MAG: hypothetical protein AUJ18_08450 [Candidatus Hydrogenedentes bacterium CG1_02_42_14]|nr:MAG: hypothetical protein AUJ18_08450 [Candidatus Hydrogenedentes bacterium CG1_02_42_14]
MNRPQIHVVIIAKDEAINIERAVVSGKRIGNVTVIDSGSVDKTIELAEAAGAKVIHNTWKGYADQRRFALEYIQDEWIFFLDADEIISPELADKINGMELTADGCRIKRISQFLGRWMKHGSWGRDSVLRLFKRNKAIIEERLVHEEVKVNGSTIFIHEPIRHFAQNDFETIGKKFTTYLPLMAAEIAKRGKNPNMFFVFLNASGAFIRDYFLRAGFLDGWQGFVLAFWGAASIIAKYAEAKRIMENTVRRDNGI